MTFFPKIKLQDDWRNVDISNSSSVENSVLWNVCSGALWGAKWAKSPVIGKIWISFICHARVVNLLIIISTQCFGMYLSNWKAKIHVYLHDKIAYFQFFQKNLNFILEDNCFVRGWTSQLRPVAGDISSIASIQHPIGLK